MGDQWKEVENDTISTFTSTFNSNSEYKSVWSFGIIEGKYQISGNKVIIIENLNLNMTYYIDRIDGNIMSARVQFPLSGKKPTSVILKRI